MTKEFARLLDQGIRTTAAKEGKQLGDFTGELALALNVSPDAIAKWRSQKNRTMPAEAEIVAELARICVERGGMARPWLTSLLTQYGYPHQTVLIDDLCPLKTTPIPHNLPAPKHTKFIGRQNDLARLLKFLSPNHAAPIISVDGIGGVGKTTLVLEAAELCLRVSQNERVDPSVPKFEAIIFTTAKQQYLTAHGLLGIHQAQRTLRDIFREIAHVLDRPEITQISPDEQPQKVKDALGRQQTLLIVDNMETVEDEQEIISFLFDLPRSVKVVLTTRNQVYFYAPLRLAELPLEHGQALIGHEAQAKGLTLQADELLALYQHTGGVPAAIVYAVGQLAAGYSLPLLLERLAERDNDVAQFCFEEAIAPLRGQAAHHLLMAIAMFPKRPLQEAIFATAGLSGQPRQAMDGLVALKRMSLINQEDNRWGMLPLTREFALSELAAHPAFEQPARERWLQWYLDFTEKYGGREWTEWHIHYDHLDAEWENLLSVLAWCAEEERYKEVVLFWRRERLYGIAHVYGYWDDMVFWADWIIDEAQRRGDWPSVVDIIGNKAFALTLTGHPTKLEEMEQLLLKTYGLCNTPALYGLADYLLPNLSYLYIRSQKYTQAQKWLDIAQEYLDQYSKQILDLDRIQTTVFYHQVVFFYEIEDYQQAKIYIQKTVDMSQTLGWQRTVIYARNYLADIAIAQNELDGVETLLGQGLEQSRRNKDRRRVAYYQRSWANLEFKRGNLAEARQWAAEAKDGFDRLGMQPEREEMQTLLDQLAEE